MYACKDRHLLPSASAAAAVILHHFLALTATCMQALVLDSGHTDTLRAL